MIKRLFGAAAIIAGISLSAWWLTSHRIAVEDDGLPVVSRDDHRWLDGLYSRNPREVQAATDEVTRRGEAAVPAIQAALRDPRSGSRARSKRARSSASAPPLRSTKSPRS